MIAANDSAEADALWQASNQWCLWDEWVRYGKQILAWVELDDLAPGLGSWLWTQELRLDVVVLSCLWMNNCDVPLHSTSVYQCQNIKANTSHLVVWLCMNETLFSLIHIIYILLFWLWHLGTFCFLVFLNAAYGRSFTPAVHSSSTCFQTDWVKAPPQSCCCGKHYHSKIFWMCAAILEQLVSYKWPQPELNTHILYIFAQVQDYKKNI